MEDKNQPKKGPSTWADIAQPGQSAPSPNSKSVIVSSHTLQNDPMLAPAAPGVEPNADHISATTPPAEVVKTNDSEAHLTNSKPIQPPHHHRLKIMLPLVVGIIILFVIADLLIDAGVVHTSITPLTHFFHHR